MIRCTVQLQCTCTMHTCTCIQCTLYIQERVMYTIIHVYTCIYMCMSMHVHVSIMTLYNYSPTVHVSYPSYVQYNIHVHTHFSDTPPHGRKAHAVISQHPFLTSPKPAATPRQLGGGKISTHQIQPPASFTPTSIIALHYAGPWELGGVHVHTYSFVY